MKESERREIFERYEKLKTEVADGQYWRIGYIVALLYKNKIGNTDYWIDKLCKIFAQKLTEKNWEGAFTIACTELGTLLPEDKEIFALTGNEERRTELQKQLAEALENELNNGNGAVRKKLSETYRLLGKTDDAKRVEQDKKPIAVGTFWGIPDKGCGRQVIAGLGVNIDLLKGEKNISGEIHPYSHWHVYKNPRSPHSQALDDTLLSGEDTFDLYPKFSISYDVNKKCHIIYVDECIKQECIDEAVSLLEIKNYIVRHDNEYVYPNCRHKYPPVELKYNILRGQERIGENLIEISYGKTKILVELGKSLDGGDEQFEQEILNKSYSAVIVSHYHEDHAGLIRQKRDCPVYIGRGAYRIVKAMCDYRGEAMTENIQTYSNCKPFEIDGIKITPFLCDHSAYDSYMLLFEAGGKSILYTGDFRFHGRKNKENLFAALPKSVDVLIHEGTNIGKNSCTMTETELENKALEIMKSTDNPVFVLQSGTNIDRLVSVYRASKRSGRILYMDNYVSQIASAAGGSIPRPDVFKDVIAFTPRAVHGKRAETFTEIINKRGLEGIANGTKRFTMLVRPTMLDYIKKLISTAHKGGATLIYSMWRGYKDNEDMKAFLDEMQSIGLNIVDLHTSGHASANDIELLRRKVNAKKTVCVHTEPDIVVFDLETTGMNCEEDYIIKIGAVKLRRGKIIDEFHSYVSCPQPLSEEIETLTGVKNKNIISAPPINEALTDFTDFALKDNCIIATYNGEFNFGFLDFNLKKCGITLNFGRFDVLSLAKTNLKDKIKNYKLITVAEHLGITTEKNSSTDENIVAQILLKLLG